MTLTAETTVDEARNIPEEIKQADKLARELLAIQGGNDNDAFSEEAFAGALCFLMRAANVTDNRSGGIHPIVALEVLSFALEVLIGKYGIEKVRDWTRCFASRLRRQKGGAS
jgi:hypothetical protein